MYLCMQGHVICICTCRDMLYVFVHAGTCLPNGIMNLTGATHKRIDLTIIEHFYYMLLLHNTDSNHKHQNDA